MGIKKPYRRTVRQFVSGSYYENGNWRYILHKNYTQNPEQYIRAYLVLQKDFENLLDYVEPSDINLKTYSFRIHELLLRVCTEIEANFVAILKENGYKKKKNWTMSDYCKINKTHFLSKYKVKFPIWHGIKQIRQPFRNWDKNILPWWNAYNNTKHNRNDDFYKASFKNLTDAICALIIVISSQFMNEDFSEISFLVTDNNNSKYETAIGEYFRILYPSNIPLKERYDFSINDISDDDPQSIQQFDYSKIKCK